MKKILFIATGGTIACAPTENGLAPKATAQRLLKAVPQLADICAIEATQPFSLDSTNMSPREWTELARIIQHSYTDYDGFVIAHGTDTLSYAAAALSCLIRSADKPIIMTGSQKPMQADNSDAPQNLYDAFLAACSDFCGVGVVFCGRLIDGRCARKIHTVNADAFASIGMPQAGEIKNGTVTLNNSGSEGIPIFFNHMNTAVSLVKLIPALDPDILDFAAEKSSVLIIEGFGAGGFPDYGEKAFERKIAQLVLGGITVIMHTQVPEGGCDMSLYEVGRNAAKKYGIIEAKNMTTEMTVMKAMWALAYSDSRDTFKELFLSE